MAIRAYGVLGVDEATQIALARGGDVRARESLYRTHLGDLLRRARFLVRDATEAEDLVQETFAAAFTSLWRFRGEASFATWLHRIALNIARHQWRAKARRRAFLRAFTWLAGGTDATASTADGATDAADDARVVQQALALLSPKLREAFVLLALERLPGDQAAKVAGVRAEVLRVRATRARARLQQALRAAQGEDAAGGQAHVEGREAKAASRES
ncbi:MAG: RNA polymerase sigma factor [Deltaproteobacteria bacterium]|nr:RNA polymerase sigma factor [Deltaproteobacteria bacterium]